MRYTKLRALSALFIIALISTNSEYACAQNSDDILRDFKQGSLPISETSTPVLLPFAMEWDKSYQFSGQSELKKIPLEQYDVLALPDSERLKASIEALSNNSDAADFFTDQKTIEAFGQAYQKAREQNTPIGMIPYEEAMRYWILSRLIAAGPKAIEAYSNGDASIQWCLPPLIRCIPPRPAPQQ